MEAKDVVLKARELGKCIPAFNIPHIPMVKPIVQAIADENSVAMVQVARVEWKKMSSESLERVAEEYHKYKNTEHTLLHLDHIPAIDEDYQQVDYISYLKRAIKAGYQSVMIDGSRLALDENIRVSLEAANIAHAAGIPCEAELGAVMGHENKQLPPYEEIFSSKMGFTDIDEAVKFAINSKCDWLSVAAGNIHGAVAEAVRNKKKPEAKLDIEHIEALYKATGVPLVMHGGSGIKHNYILDAINVGIAKINVGTELRQAYEFALDEKPGDIVYAQEKVYRVCRDYISNYLMNTDLKDELAAEGTVRKKVI
jgi:fructose-bisphosphate aldolase class II